MTIIYLLADPREPDPVRRVRYVGKTSRRPMLRLRAHIYHARTIGRSYVQRWIQSLLAEGVHPVLEELCSVPNEDANEAERQAIADWKGRGARLANLTDGGDGAPGYRHTADACQRISRAARARNITIPPEQHARMIEASRNCSPEAKGRLSRPITPELRAKMVAGIQTEACRQKMVESGRNRPPASSEHRANLSKAGRRRFEDPAQRARQGRSTKGRTWKWSDEARAKMSALKKGRGPLTPEHRAKLSAAGRGRPMSEKNKAALHAANTGRRFTEEHKANLVEGQRAARVRREGAA